SAVPQALHVRNLSRRRPLRAPSAPPAALRRDTKPCQVWSRRSVECDRPARFVDVTVTPWLPGAPGRVPDWGVPHRCRGQPPFGLAPGSPTADSRLQNLRDADQTWTFSDQRKVRGAKRHACSDIPAIDACSKRPGRGTRPIRTSVRRHDVRLTRASGFVPFASPPPFQDSANDAFRRRANYTYPSRLCGLDMASGLATLSALAPSNSLRTGSSIFLPLSVRGSSVTASTSLGTCRAEALLRICSLMRLTNASSSSTPSARTTNRGM